MNDSSISYRDDLVLCRIAHMVNIGEWKYLISRTSGTAVYSEECSPGRMIPIMTGHLAASIPTRA